MTRAQAHARWFAGLMMLPLVCVTGCTPPPATTDVSTDESTYQTDPPRVPQKSMLSRLNRTEQCIYWRINEVRRKKGLMPLTLRPDLQRVARQHSGGMAQTGVVSLYSPDGLDIGRQLTAEGVRWNFCAINLAALPHARPPDVAQKAVDSWMETASSRKDILFQLYAETGISAVWDAKTGQWFISQVFARRTSYWAN